MTVYTATNGTIKADLTALAAIPSTDLPASGFVVLFVAAENDDFLYNSSLTSGDVTPIDNPITGRWIRVGRDRLRANRTYYVRTDGSDSNNGLANTSGGAFLTISKAVSVVRALDLNGFNVSVTCIGDFTSNGTIDIFLPIGAGDFILQGDTGSITATKIKKIKLDSQSALCRFIIDAFTLENADTNASALEVANSAVYHGRINYNTTGFPINVAGRSTVFAYLTNSSINFSKISGTLSVLGICSNNSLIQFQGMTGSITLTGTPAFAVAQWYAEGNSFINLGGVTITGAFTGTQYTTVASSNSTIRKPDFSYQSST